MQIIPWAQLNKIKRTIEFSLNDKCFIKEREVIYIIYDSFFFRHSLLIRSFYSPWFLSVLIYVIFYILYIMFGIRKLMIRSIRGNGMRLPFKSKLIDVNRREK